MNSLSKWRLNGLLLVRRPIDGTSLTDRFRRGSEGSQRVFGRPSQRRFWEVGRVESDRFGTGLGSNRSPELLRLEPTNTAVPRADSVGCVTWGAPVIDITGSTHGVQKPEKTLWPEGHSLGRPFRCWSLQGKLGQVRASVASGPADVECEGRDTQ